MKKIVLIVCAFGLLMSCSKEEYSQKNTQENKGETIGGISFVYQPVSDTKAEYIKDGSSWNSFWYGETDRIAIFSKNAEVKYSDSRAIPTIWDSNTGGEASGVGSATGTAHPVSYKATQSLAEGRFTAIDDNNRIDFNTDPSAPAPSVRVVWPGTITTATWASAEQETMKITIPANNAQTQSDAAGASCVAYNIMLAANPSELDAYDETENPAGIQFPDKHQTLAQSIPLKLERQFPVFYTNLKNYTGAVKSQLGALSTVTVTLTTSDGSTPINCAYSSAAATMDILYKYDEEGTISNLGEYTVDVNGASEANSIALTVDPSYSYNADDNETGENLYITFNPNVTVQPTNLVTIAYAFAYGTITEQKVITRDITYKKNTFYNLGTLDVAAQPILVLNSNHLIINDSFTGNIADLVDGSNIVYNGTTLIAVSSVTNLTINRTTALTTEEVTALDNLTALTSMTLATAGTLTNLPTGAAAGLQTLTLPEATAMSAEGITAINLLTNLTTLSMPALTVIPDEAFTSLTNLTSVTLTGATTWGSKAFAATGLTTIAAASTPTILISDQLTTLNANALVGLTGLTSVTLPGVTTIGAKAFDVHGNNTASSINTLVLPEVTATGIANNAFGLTSGEYTSYVAGLTTLTMPKCDITGTLLAMHLVKKVTALAHVNLSAVTRFATTDELLTSVQFAENTNLLDIVIGENAVIEPSAFKGCTGLATVTNLDKATEIGEEAFRGCSALKNSNTITLNAATISQSAFKSSGIVGLVLGTAVTTIEESAFESCSSITSVSLGGVTTIGKNAFKSAGASAFAVDFKNVTAIGESAFESSKIGATNLSNVETLGLAAFKNCVELTGILDGTTGISILNVGATLIPANTFFGCIKIENMKFLNAVTVNTDALKIAHSAQKTLTINFMKDVTIAATSFLNMTEAPTNTWTETADTYNPLIINFGGTLNGVTAKTNIRVGNADVFTFTPAGGNEQTYTVTKVGILQ